MRATTASAPPRPVDVRVADSPVVSLRFHIDSRIADLDLVAGELERELIDTSATRANVMVHLRRNEEVRRHTLDVMPQLGAAPLDVRANAAAAFSQGLQLAEEVARLDERTAGMKARLGDLAAEQRALRTVAAEFATVPNDGFSIDARVSRYNQAARQMQQIVDAEHDATARVILEGPMQRLTDAALEAELVGRSMRSDPALAAEAGTRCRTAAADAAAQLGEVIAELRPLKQDRGFVAALRELILAWEARGIVRVQVIGIERRLGQIAEIATYRILEEAIDNALRHGRAQRIDVVVSFHPERVVAVVKDDGDGFDIGATDARLGRTHALGLIQMRERAALAGGRLEVRSVLGRGTEVRVTVGAAVATTASRRAGVH